MKRSHWRARLPGSLGDPLLRSWLSEPGKDDPTLDEVERRYLKLLLERHGGNRRPVAEVLGISGRTAYRMIERFGLR